MGSHHFPPRLCTTKNTIVLRPFKIYPLHHFFDHHGSWQARGFTWHRTRSRWQNARTGGRSSPSGRRSRARIRRRPRPSPPAPGRRCHRARRSRTTSPGSRRRPLCPPAVAFSGPRRHRLRCRDRTAGPVSRTRAAAQEPRRLQRQMRRTVLFALLVIRGRVNIFTAYLIQPRTPSSEVRMTASRAVHQNSVSEELLHQ